MKLQDGLDLLAKRGVEPHSLAWLPVCKELRFDAADVAALGRPVAAEVTVGRDGYAGVKLVWTVDEVRVTTWSTIFSHIMDGERMAWLWMVALVDLGAALAAYDAMCRSKGTTFVARREVAA